MHWPGFDPSVPAKVFEAGSLANGFVLAAHPFTKEKRYEFEESGNDGGAGGGDCGASGANRGLARPSGK